MTTPSEEPEARAENTSAPGGRISLFDKARRFFSPEGEYAMVKGLGLYPYFYPIQRNEGARAIIDGHEVIMAGSNNYLGLTSDPRVQEAARYAITTYGTGCTGSRFLNGTLDLHIELEARLAEFMGYERAVLFSTGYMTNQGVIQGITTKGEYVFSDKDNHACIVAGTQVSLAETVRFLHNDMDHLRRQLERVSDSKPDAGKLVVSDGVFSMSGVIANVPSLVALAEEFGAAVMVDDAHAIGVVGPGGRGTAAHFGLTDRVSLTTGTFSKSFASLGGFAVGDRDVIDFVRHSSSAHIYSASMPPANVATVLKCLDILQEEPERVERLWEIAHYMRDGFVSLGFDVWTSQTPIIPVVIGDWITCFRFWRDLLEAGVFVNPIIPPAVPQGQALMRTSYMATHTNEDLDRILETFHKVGLKHGIVRSNGMPAMERTGDGTKAQAPAQSPSLD